ncbi:hypothetical protein RGQ29_017518 [Quercus rubra]|uniref:BED-type domain-containing protein n=1 Tax=Quercus rubra TaxID=3512 RepID=A0AAN7IXV4_QUERU|nr:hypothetical protein RGQ29_017518 [Quercus rubra]
MESDEMIPIEIKYEGEDIDLEDELDEVAELPPPKKAKTKSKNKTNHKDNTRRRTSYVWSFFELLPTKDEEKPTCKCKKCGKEYIAAGAYGTGNLKRHLDLILGQNAMSVSSPKFDPAKFRELLCAAITMHELPFWFVEYVGIRAIFSYLCVDVPNISRNTAKNDLVKMYKREKERMKSVLTSAPGRVCLTSDLWTSITTDGYMCVTAHFIDGYMCKTVLNFCHMPPPHNGVSLFEKVYKLLSMWGIENKIFCVTLDNASSNDKALVCNGEFFSSSLLCSYSQFGCTRCIKYVRGSQGRKKSFYESVKQMDLDGKKGLRQDVPTRWNSTFLMLQKVLGCFLRSTLVFSGTKYPTANLYFPQVFIVYFTLKKESDNEDEYMRKMVDQMLVKFEKYWIEFSVVLAIAVVLDPRYKLPFIDWCYQKLYGHASSLQYLKVREKLFALFGEYVSNVPTPSTSSGMAGQATQETEEQYANEGSLSMMQEFDSFHSMDVGRQAQKTQLELYLDEPRMDRNAKLDILAFWKGNEFRYPELAAMARDILSIPISTVASESTFSVGGRVIDQFKSALKPDVVEASVCTRDWLYADMELAQSQLEELTEDIMNMNINKDEHKEDTSSMEPSMDPVP